MATSSHERGPVELLAEEFVARRNQGEHPTIGEYCERHPEIAQEIRDAFEALTLAEELKSGSDLDGECFKGGAGTTASNWFASATIVFCVRSAAAAWAWSTKPSRKRWAAGLRSRCCR